MDAPTRAPATSDVRGATRFGRPFWRNHAVFTSLFVLAFALRLIATLGYRWALWFNDSYEYVGAALHLQPHNIRPSGYSVMLRALEPLHSFAVVTIVQHLMGLACGVLVYALLRHRYRLPGWGASLAAVPALFDAYQIALEHLVLSDTLFGFLTVLAVTIALWRRTISVKRGIVIGLLIAGAALTRSVGLPLLAVFVGYLLLRRVGWRVLVSTVTACVIPMVLYMGWFLVAHGQFAMTTSNGSFLYVRVMSFANCKKIDPPVDELPLCTSEPTGERPVPQYYIWGKVSPLHRVWAKNFTVDQSTVAGDFAKRAILAQPLDYLHDVGASTLRTFYWTHNPYPDPDTYGMYKFGSVEKPLPTWQVLGNGTAAEQMVEYAHGRASTNIVEPFAGIMRGYQRWFFLRGTLLGVILLAGAAGVVGRWRRPFTREETAPGVRGWAVARWRGVQARSGSLLLSFGVSVALILAPPVTTDFDYRYVLPAVPFACIAAAVALARSRTVKRAVAKAGRLLPFGRAEGAGEVSTRVPEPVATATTPGPVATAVDEPEGRSSETATA
ncbi:MAG TPA: hypothetical protein VGL93_29370 [Streptosporangiaceae bacterium]